MADEFDFSDLPGVPLPAKPVQPDPFGFADVGEAGSGEFDFSDVAEQEPTFVDEAGRAISSGLQRGGEGVLGLALKPLELVMRALNEGGESPEKSSFDLAREGVRRGFGERQRPQTTGGRVGEALTQFLAPFGLLSKAGKAVGIGERATRLGRLGQIEATALGAEQIAFDPHEARLSNLIQEVPALQNPVTEFLSADEEDTETEARFKMALESLGLGAITGGLLESLRFMRRGRQAKPPVQNTPDVDPQIAREQEGLIELSTNIDAAKRAGEIPQPKASAAPVDPNLNTARLGTSDEVITELKRVEAANDNFAPARRGVVSHEETRRLADTMGVTEDELLSLRKGQTLNAHEALSARQMLVDSGEKLVQLAKDAKSGAPESLFELRRAMARHTSIQEKVAGATAEAGRLLNQFNIVANSTGARRTQAIGELLSRDTGIEDIAAKIADMETPEQVSKFVRETDEPRLIDKALEVWINSLLSGPQTHAVNMLSNAMVSLWTVPENLLAAGIGKLRTKGPAGTSARGALSRAFGFVQGGKDGIRLAWEAIKDPDSVPIGLGTKLETRPKALGEGRIAQAVNLPGRFLQAEDRLFQSIGYRMELNQQAIDDGLAKGLKGRELGRHVQGILQNTPDDIVAKAQGAARYQTFTQAPGPVAASIMKIADTHPMLRFIVPFVRTPSNILKFAAERTPLGTFTKSYKDAIKAGGKEADVARSRLLMGSSFMAWVTSQAMEGNITGKGPTDPEARALWRETKQPYSIKVNDEWVSFQRIEPLGVLMGIAADASTIFNEAASGEEADKIAAGLGAAVANNLTSKTWLKGISDLVKMASDPQRYGERWVQNYAGTVVPAGVAQLARTQDPILRDVRSLTDAVQARIPGYSEDLPARLNLFGEPIVSEGGIGPDIASPLWTKSIKSKPLVEEMQRVKAQVQRPERKIQGVELTPRQYHDFAKAAGQTATQILRSAIRNPGYKTLPDFAKRELIEKTFKSAREVQRIIAIAEFNLGAEVAKKKTESVTE